MHFLHKHEIVYRVRVLVIRKRFKGELKGFPHCVRKLTIVIILLIIMCSKETYFHNPVK